LDRNRASAIEWTASPRVRRPAELTSPAILNHLARKGSLGGFVRDGGELYLVGGSAVQPTSQPAPRAADGVRGYLVVGGSLHGELLRGLERDLQLGIRILPADTPVPDTPLHAEMYAADDSVRILFPLAGVTGEPAAVIAIMDTRVQQHRFAAWTLYGELIAVTLCAVAY